MVGAATIIVLLHFFENRLIFYPDPVLDASPDQRGLAYEDVEIRTSDGVGIHGWFIHHGPEYDAPLAYLLFFHGNAGNISHRLDNLEGLAQYGFSVLIIDYRGYGRSEGRPSEQGTYRDAAAAYEYLLSRPGVTPDRVVIFGRSLGGAVAVELALNAPARALILESTFTSVRDMARVHFALLPPFLVSRKYDSVSKIGRVSTPTLFIHGELDDLAPIALGRRLFLEHPGPKSFYAIPRAGHNDTFLIGREAYYQRLADFSVHPVED